MYDDVIASNVIVQEAVATTFIFLIVDVGNPQGLNSLFRQRGITVLLPPVDAAL